MNNFKNNDNENETPIFDAFGKNVAFQTSPKYDEDEISLSTIKGPISDPKSVRNKKYQKFFSRWEVLKNQLIDFRKKCIEKSKMIDKKHWNTIEEKFNSRVLKLNEIAGELQLADTFFVSNLVLGDNSAHEPEERPVNNFESKESTPLDYFTGSFNNSPSTQVVSDIEKIHSTFSQKSENVDEFKTPNSTNRGPDLDISEFKSLLDSNQDKSFANIEENLSFAESNLAEDNYDNEIKAESFQIPNTHVATTIIDEDEKKEKELIQKTAVNKTMDSLILTADAPNISIDDLYQKKGLKIQTRVSKEPNKIFFKKQDNNLVKSNSESIESDKQVHQEINVKTLNTSVAGSSKSDDSKIEGIESRIKHIEDMMALILQKQNSNTFESESPVVEIEEKTNDLLFKEIKKVQKNLVEFNNQLTKIEEKVEVDTDEVNIKSLFNNLTRKYNYNNKKG